MQLSWIPTRWNSCRKLCFTDIYDCHPMFWFSLVGLHAYVATRSNWQFISVNLVSSPCILLNFKPRKGFSTNCIKEFNTCEIYTASEKSAALFDNNGLFSSTQALVSSVVLGVLFWIMVLHTLLSFAAHQKYIFHIFYSLWWWLREFGLCFPSYLYFCETGSHGWRVACS